MITHSFRVRDTVYIRYVLYLSCCKMSEVPVVNVRPFKNCNLLIRFLFIEFFLDTDIEVFGKRRTVTLIISCLG